MEKLLKKFLYTGVGLVATTADHLQKQINETVEKTNQSEVEGKRIVTDLMTDIKSQASEFDTKFRNTIDNVLSRFELPTKEEVENLHTKIALLEVQIDVTEEELVEELEEGSIEL